MKLVHTADSLVDEILYEVAVRLELIVCRRVREACALFVDLLQQLLQLMLRKGCMLVLQLRPEIRIRTLRFMHGYIAFQGLHCRALCAQSIYLHKSTFQTAPCGGRFLFKESRKNPPLIITHPSDFILSVLP